MPKTRDPKLKKKLLKKKKMSEVPHGRQGGLKDVVHFHPKPPVKKKRPSIGAKIRQKSNTKTPEKKISFCKIC